MNKEIALKRYMDVMRPDVMHSSQGDFLATHVPMKKLYITNNLTDHADVPEQDKKHPKTEEEVYSEFMSESEDDQFVLVVGDSGAGKSHLIRWIKTMHELRKSDSEIILPIRRADNTLKGTIRQLIELPEIKDLPNKDLYKKLASASTAVPEQELKNTLYYSFIIQIENDDGKAGDEEGERKISNVDRKHLLALLQNTLFKDRLMRVNGPIDLLYTKLAENKSNDVNDVIAEFTLEDFEIDSDFRNQLLVGADGKARKIADKLLDNIEFSNTVREYMNLFVEKVIQRCAGLEPGDLAEVIREIRQELYKQGKTLTILIEDITAASGVDDSLLDALLTDKIEYPDEKLCRLNAIVGSTDGYYREKFKTNTKGRIRKFVYVPGDLFDGNVDGLYEFFAKYLNTISLDEHTIQNWVVMNQANEEAYPIHKVTIGKGWDEYKYKDQRINLFPFSKRAILFLYNQQDITKRNPRALMREIIEPYVRDSIEHLKEFPIRRPALGTQNSELHNAINNLKGIDDSTKIRLRHFMYVWGNGRLETYTEDNIKYVAGIPDYVYEELNLPIIDANEVETPVEKEKIEEQSISQAINKLNEDNVLQETENELVNNALAEVDKWIEQSDYKLNVGATTKNVRALNDARKNINDYLFNTIDWISEGVSIDAAVKIRDTGNKFFVAFERQTMKSDAIITLPATISSRKIIEAFVKWSEVGGKSWNFPGSTDYLYRIQVWSDGIKKKIVDSMLTYEDKTVNYFSYATAAEYLRLILNGYCQKYEKAANLTPELLLNENPGMQEINGHTKSWNDLMKMVNSTDGMSNRNCVLQYYNLPQGTAITSKNYEFDYVEFNKAVRKVINGGFIYKDEELQLDDPIKKRRLYSEYLKKILDRIDKVVQDEKTAIKECMNVLEQNIEIEELDSSEDIEDILNDIDLFYKTAEKSHVRAAIHYDSALIRNLKKESSALLSSIKTSVQILKVENPIDSLIKISKDPLYKLKVFTSLIEKVSADIVQTNEEANQKMKDKGVSDQEEASEDYCYERSMLAECRNILEEVKVNYAGE